jgi:hypothetical protein
MPLVLWLLACTLLASCSSRPAPSATISPAEEIQGTPTLSTPSADTFLVDAWMSNPTPSRDSKVVLIGNLRKDGVYLGGIIMRATWPDETHTDESPNCYVTIIYQRGVCTIDVSHFKPGILVPIQISIEYQGKLYYGQTQFIPK